MTNETKQTAVEWLQEQLFNSLGVKLSDHQSKMANDIFFKQAKEMEKEQIMQFWDEGVISATYGKPISFEQYYEETYGGNK